MAMLQDLVDAYKGKIVKPSDALLHKTTHLMQDGMNARAFGEYEKPKALGLSLIHI